MAEPRLSKILIGALMIGLFSLSFMLFLSDGASTYNAEGYTNSTLESFTSTSNEINSIANKTQTTLGETGAVNNGFDIFGSFFSNAWTALKSTWSSITTISSLSVDAVDQLPNVDNQFKTQLKTFFVSVILIIIVIGIFFHFIKASNRL